MGNRTCPVWMGYLLASPVRKLFHNPNKIIEEQVSPGMRVLDVGCAMGFFSLPMARRVGPSGKVVCVDIQERMIRKLQERARKAGLSERIEARVCNSDSLALDDMNRTFNFILAFAVVHEITDNKRFFEQIWRVTAPYGRVLFVEPKGHVSEKEFEKCLSQAEDAGFDSEEYLKISKSHAVLMEKRARD
ncbi:MAG: class I SAM-dependent methyltransferase [Dehalococcoidia bacterium]